MRYLFAPIIVLSFFVALAGIFNAPPVLSAGSVNITATIDAVCGNGVAETGEQCDGSDLAGASCSSKGFSGGTLTCNADCAFNASQCTIGGGGGGIYIQSAPPPKPGLPTCDFNRNGKCNLKDLSILLFWWDKTGPEIAPYDLNKDGRIDIVDISILLYYWTG